MERNREPLDDERTPLIATSVPVASRRPADQGTVVVVIDASDSRALVASRRRRWDQILVKLRSRSLDDQLASGVSPDDSVPRAVRAVALVAPDARHALARDWEDLLDRARGPQPVLGARVPLPRERILAAENEIRELIASLRANSPVPARGVAMANVLLTDGTGPVYSRRCDRDLRAAVRDAIHHLDPSAELIAPTGW